MTSATITARPDGRLADNIVYFARTLRKAGMRVGPASVKDAIEALVRLTAEGRRMFRTMAAAHEEWVAEAFADLSPGEIETLMRLLAKAKGSARRAAMRGDDT